MTRKSPVVKYVILALALMFGLCTLFLTIKLGNALYWQHISKNLMVTHGLMEYVNLVKAHPAGMGTGKVRPSDRWWLEVRYSYEVGGKPYISNKLNSANSGGGTEFLTLANTYEKALREQREVSVYYYQADPSKSVLIPDADARNLTANTIIVIVFSMLTCALLVAYRVTFGKPAQKKA